MRKVPVMLAAALALAACDDNHGLTGGSGANGVPSSVTVSPGYSVAVFAQAPGVSSSPPACDASSPGCYTKPDSIVQLGTGSSSTIFVGYGDALQPDGTISSTDSATGTVQIVQYDLSGKQLGVYTVPGHNDGLMVFDDHTVWAMSDEDANPLLSIIDTTAGTVTTYSADALPSHGGGLDDMQLIGGTVFTSASNPKLDAATSLYDNSAVYSLTLNNDGVTFHLTPVMAGDATAFVINPSATGVTTDGNGDAMLGDPLVPNGSTINPGGLQDPDSMSIDASGNLVLDSQADSELVFIANPGQANQSVQELFLTLYTNPWPVDDTRWAPASSQFMLVTDTAAGLIYKISASGGFMSGTVYSAGQGTVLLDDTSTGAMTPIVTGMDAPHGMVFVQ